MLRKTHKHELTSFIFPYSATSSRGVASFLLFWRNNAHSQGKWIHFCSQVSIFIYIYTGILGTSDLALSFFSRPKWRACPYSLHFSFFLYFYWTTSPYRNGPFTMIVQLQVCRAALHTPSWLAPKRPQNMRNTKWWGGSTQTGVEMDTCGDQRGTMAASLLWPLSR